MAYDLEIDGRVVLLRFHGPVDASDLMRAVNVIAADPSFDEQRFHVVDCSAATLPSLDDHVLDAMIPVIGATRTNPQIDTIFIPDCDQTRSLAQFCRPVFERLRSISFAPDLGAAQDWINAQTTTVYRCPER